MTFNEYQVEATKTAMFPPLAVIGEEGITEEVIGYVYPALGLAGEAGEVAEKIKKAIRDSKGKVTEEWKEEIKKELGDVLWYIAILAKEFGLDLQDVANLNIEKLSSRKNRGTIQGSGDNR